MKRHGRRRGRELSLSLSLSLSILLSLSPRSPSLFLFSMVIKFVGWRVVFALCLSPSLGYRRLVQSKDEWLGLLWFFRNQGAPEEPSGF